MSASLAMFTEQTYNQNRDVYYDEEQPPLEGLVEDNGFCARHMT